MADAALLPLLLFLLLVGYLVFVLTKSRGTSSGVKLMLLGISIILVGGIIAVDDNSNLGGFEYYIVLLGLIFTVGGFGKEN